MEEACALIDSDAKVDLLFTDMRLGDEHHGGIVVANYGREHNAEIRVLYTTGSGVNDGTRALFVEHHWFLPKPYRPSDLEIAVENARLTRTPKKAK